MERNAIPRPINMKYLKEDPSERLKWSTTVRAFMPMRRVVIVIRYEIRERRCFSQEFHQTNNACRTFIVASPSYVSNTRSQYAEQNV